MAMTRKELEGAAAAAAEAAAYVRTITAAMAAAIDPSGNVLNIAMRISFYKTTAEELTLEEVLFAAVHEGNLSVAARTLEFGADVNLLAASNLPLHQAVQTGSLDMVKFLLAHGAGPNGLNSDYFTPIGILCELGHFSHNDLLILQELLRSGADPEIKDNYPEHDERFPIIKISNLAAILQHQANWLIRSEERARDRLFYNEIIALLLDYGADLGEARRNFIAVAEEKSKEANRRLADSRHSLQREINEPMFGLSAEDQERFLKQRQDDVLASEERVASLELWKETGLKFLQEIRLRREAKLRCVFNQGVVAGFNGMSADVANHMLLPFFRESKKDVVSARIFNLGYNKGVDKFAAEEATKIKTAAARARAVDAMEARMLVGAASAAANAAEQEHKGAGTPRPRSMRA